MRVLFFLTDLEIGGTPGVVRDLAIRLREPDIETAVACLAPRGPMADEIEHAGVPVVPLGARTVAALPAVLPRFVRVARQFDVVFSFLMHANTTAAIASRWLPNARLIEAIQTTQPYPAWHWPLQGMAAAAAERIVVPSASVARAAIEWAGVPEERITIVPNAIDVDVFERLREDRVAALPFRVGFIGRLDPIKRVPDLVRAISMLPGVALDVYGEGADRHAILAATTTAGVGDRVRMHGRIAGPQEALRQIDVLALPSDAEGFPLVLIEAMAAGVPIVAADAPGIRDVVRHDETALLVPPRSPPALARAIDRLRTDAALRARLGQTASAFVREHFTWERVLARYRALLKAKAC